MSNPKHFPADEFARQVNDRLKAATADVMPSAELGVVVESRARSRARRTARVRIVSLAAVAALTVTGVAWARSGSTPSKSASTSTAPLATDGSPTSPIASDAATTSASGADPTVTLLAPETFPSASPNAINLLVVGADNNGCADDGDVSAGSLDGRESLGARSDTIMVVRIDPSTNRVAILSFPRDLWVQIAGTDKRSRLNSAFTLNDPQRLIDTIGLNFGIPIAHYLQLDFCGFKQIVDVVGGVAVPFEYPARDDHTGLDVPSAGCFAFDGDAALGYVRSRHYTYLDPTTNEYREDPASDYGRIARQQDFVRRLATKVIEQELTPDAARDLIGAATEYVVTDPDFTLDVMIELAGVWTDIDGAAIPSYWIDGVGKTISGAAVLEPALNSENMVKVLEIFRGLATIPAGDHPTPIEPVGASDPTGSTSVAEPSDSEFDQPLRGIVPPADVRC